MSRNNETDTTRVARYSEMVVGIKPKIMAQYELDSIVADLCLTEWRDEVAKEMVESLVGHILAVDDKLHLKLEL